jgi:hypothetical protein
MKNENIFRFNWIALKKEATTLAENDAKRSLCYYIVILVGIMTGYVQNKYSKKSYIASLRLLALKDKPNFLLNVESMLAHRKAALEDKCLLIFLSSKRNYSDYALKGITYIPYMLVEKALKDYDWKNNALLSLEEGFIHFKFTEK